MSCACRVARASDTHQGEPELTPFQKAAVAAAAAELQAQAAAAAAGCGGAGALRPPDAGACGACGAAGCSPGCSESFRHLVAPPHARCIPRGPTFFFGWRLGFNPLGAGSARQAASADKDGDAKAAREREYWRELAKMTYWQVGCVGVAGCRVIREQRALQQHKRAACTLPVIVGRVTHEVIGPKHTNPLLPRMHCRPACGPLAWWWWR